MESVRRVSSIALVHDALSMSVDEEVNLDEVVDRIVPIMNDVATVDSPIRINRVGDLGVLDADRAMARQMLEEAIAHLRGAREAAQIEPMRDRLRRAAGDADRGLAPRVQIVAVAAAQEHYRQSTVAALRKAA